MLFCAARRVFSQIVFLSLATTIMRNIAEIRRHYQQGKLNKEDLFQDPMNMFYRWWDEVVNAEVPEANAMVLSTVSEKGQPTSRVVLLKNASSDGFEFYTNYESDKANHIRTNPNVSLLFFWKEIERQVRIDGVAEQISREKSQVYFQSRPRGSQIGAWASPQSRVIEDRNILEEAFDKIYAQFENVDPLPCPEHWGGYLVKPQAVEFWQGRSDRLHDRFRYTRNEKGDSWTIDRLAP